MPRKLKTTYEFDGKNQGAIKAAQGVASEFEQLEKRTGAVSGKMNATFTSLKKNIVGLGGIMAAAGAAKFFIDGLKDLEAFDKGLHNVNTIINVSKAKLKEYGREIEEIRRLTGEGAREITDAWYQTVSAGVEAAESIRFVKIASQAAIAGLSDTKTAVDGITTVVNAFHLEASEAENVADIMFKTVKLGKTTFSEISSSISNVAGLASAAGISFEEISGAIATLTKQGYPTAQAMTMIRQSIIGMNEELGDGWADQMTYQEGLNLIAKKANGSQNELKKMIGRIEGVNAVLGLTGTNAKVAADDLEGMNTAFGEMGAAFEEQSESIEFKLKRMNTAIETAASSIMSSISPVITSFAEGITSTINGLSEALSPVEDTLRNERIEVTKLTTALTDSNTPAEERKKIYSKLKEISPDIVKGIDDENIALSTLRKNLEIYNGKLVERIILKTKEKEIMESAETIADLQISKEELKNRLHESLAKNAQKMADKEAEYREKFSSGFEHYTEKIKRTNEVLTSGLSLQEKIQTISKEGLFGSAAEFNYNYLLDDVKLLGKINSELIQKKKTFKEFQEEVQKYREEMGLITKEPSGGNSSADGNSGNGNEGGNGNKDGNDSDDDDKKKIALPEYINPREIEDFTKRLKEDLGTVILPVSPEIDLPEKPKLDIELPTSEIADFILMQQETADTFGMMGDAAYQFYEMSGKQGGIAFELFKGFSIAQTAIKTYESAVNAYNAMVGIPVVGPGLAVAAAAAATTFGLAQMSQIARMQPGSRGGGVSGASVVTPRDYSTNYNSYSGDTYNNSNETKKEIHIVINGLPVDDPSKYVRDYLVDGINKVIEDGLIVGVNS